MLRTSLVVFAMIGCSSSSDTGTPGSSGSSGGAVQIDASRTFKGALTLTGTIALPKGSGSGKSIQLTASGGGADFTQKGSFVAPAGTTQGEAVAYTITGLVAGEYSVRARIDQDGNGALGPGDLDGYTGGTVEAPVLDFSKAKKVTVGPSGATGVDFGLAPVP